MGKSSGDAPAAFDWIGYRVACGELEKALQNTRIQYGWNGSSVNYDQADSLVQIVIHKHTENPWI